MEKDYICKFCGKIEKVEQQNGIKIIILDKDNLTWESIKEKI